MVSVLAITPKVCGFLGDLGDVFLRAKIRSTSSFEGEVKPEDYVVRFYGM
jgi:hypothetical protein